MSEDVAEWLQRHCLRASNSGYACPFTCIFSQGKAKIAIVNREDPSDLYPHCPVEFIEDAELTEDRQEIRDVLSEFVNHVIARLDGFEDERVSSLRAQWQTVQGLSAEEEEFCRASGRLGLDPFDMENWPAGLLSWFERALPGELDSAFAMDLMETPGPAREKSAHHQALHQIIESFHLGPAANIMGPAFNAQTPYDEGYSLAEWVRRKLGLAQSDQLADVNDAAEVACQRALRIQTSNLIPQSRVLAVVGWARNPGPIIAMRDQPKLDAARFLCARGVYMASRASSNGPRLVTEEELGINEHPERSVLNCLPPALESGRCSNRRCGGLDKTKSAIMRLRHVLHSIIM
ncbi:MAG: hypothetical protein IPO88_13810 [Nannocystis sp.]|uniref:hypothetical protein n=1 Tax=Nannocystis sp. TaxID=1962667 RepID=UPI0024273175|nr:hypothetical protein [Nannocystis sp.]MBK9754554.1 hypothetical protein [Nannocystis sp.]